MKQMRLWCLAGAMATVIGCGDDPPATTPPTEDVPVADVDMTDTQPTEDNPAPTDTQPTEDNPVPADMQCATGETRCGDLCVNLMDNNANCGVCGTACTGTQVCRGGACIDDTPCPSGQARCGGTCTEVLTNAMNCGACGNACAAGESCSGGTCVAEMACSTAGQTRCAGTCTDTMTDATNCGACGTACAAGQVCMAGACRASTTCATGQTACGGTCVDTMTDLANCGACANACPTGQVCTAGTCGAMACPSGQIRCGTDCANTQTDPANCGMCGRACAMGQTCSAGTCSGAVTCPTGQSMCGTACADLATDPTNCGTCARACSAGQTCTGGTCVTPRMCATGQTDCTPTGASMTCVDLQTSNANCGACGTACPTGQTCTAGACVCGTGTTRCDRTCANLQTDPANCGACGTACPTGQTCTAGRCACAAGQMICNGTCVNTTTDNANCGACGTVCPMGQTCSAGRCACAAGQTTCSGACVNTQTDRANCGGCARACAMGQTCTAGVCGCPTGQRLCGTGAAATCVDTMTNSRNCGACGTVCGTGTSCMAGRCAGTPPANDTRAGATVISLTNPSQTLTANTTAARNDTTGSCGCTSGNDVFFQFTLTQPEVVYADTLGATWDTSLFIQNAAGTNVTATTGFVTCNDDASAAGLCSGIAGLQTQIVARLAAGTYYLVLSGCSAGTAQIHFQHLPAGNGPSARVTPDATLRAATGTTSGTGTVSSTCCSGGPDNAYWWVTCPSTAAATFNASSCNTTTGVNLAAYDLEVAQYSALRAGAGAQVCNDDTGSTCGAGSTLTSTIPATAANQVGLNTMIVDSCIGSGAYTVNYILASCATGARCGATCVDTNTSVTNCGGCNLRCATGAVCAAGACVPPPANDTPAGAVTSNMSNASSTFTVDTRSAANNTAGPCACTTGRDVFYNFTIPAAAPEIVYADTIGSTSDTSLFVQTSTGTNITATNLPTNGIACNDDGGLAGCSTGTQSQILLRLNPGAYRLVVSGCGNGGTVNLRFHHLPVGNGAVAYLAAGTSTPAGVTSGTGRVSSACGSAGPENTYYWFTCAASRTGAFRGDTCGRATWDTELDQRSAARTTPGVSVCNDDVSGTCGARSTVNSTIPAGAGLHTLYIDGFSAAAAGVYSVSITRP